MKREFLLFIVILVVALSAMYVLVSPDVLGASGAKDGRPLACFLHGGSTTGNCR